MQAGVTRRGLLRSAGSAATIAAGGSVPATGAAGDSVPSTGTGDESLSVTEAIGGSVAADLSQTSEVWPMFARDEANTGYAPDGTGPAGDVGGAWRFDTDEAVVSSPAVVDGTVYVGSNDSNLYALSAADGTVVWRFQTGGRVSSSPAVVDGTVYVGGEDGFVYAIDAETGEAIWSFETGDPVVSSPTVADGTVYIGSRDDHVYAIDAAEGTEEWSFLTANDVSATPAVVDGTVYVGGEDFVVYAIDAEAGEEVWRFETGREITAGPAVSGGTVYVGGLDGRLHAIRDGELRWGVETGGPIVSSPAVAGGTVYAGSRDGKLYALAADSGDQQWSFDTGWQVTGSPTVAGGVVHVGTQGGDVFGLDTGDGERLWRFNAGRAVTGAPAAVDGALFVGSGTGSVYALEEGARLPVAETPTPAPGGGSDGGTPGGFAFLLFPLAVVALVVLSVGTLYAAKRAGLFRPIVKASPFPGDSEAKTPAKTAPDEEQAAGTQADEEQAAEGSGEPALPIRDVVLDDVIGRAEETARTATQDLLVTKFVDRETLSSPVVAYEIESVRTEPATVRVTEGLDTDEAAEDAIGRLPGGPDEWRVEDDTLVFEAEIEPGETVRTIVARQNLSPEDADVLLDRPGVEVRD